MIKQAKSPYGYRELLVYKKAEALQLACSDITSHFSRLSHSPHYKTLLSLADQMDRSARSGKQNIVEGWKRNSTKEYYEFLGFAIGANAELEEDCNDILKGMYPDVMGVMGLRGERGEKGEDSDEGGETWTIEDVEKLAFYPLDSHLPPLIQLKLRTKELNFLLEKLQKALLQKMTEERTLPRQDVAVAARREETDEKAWLEQTLKEHGLNRSENGKVSEKEEIRN